MRNEAPGRTGAAPLVAFASLVAFAGFLLLRPLFDAAPAYRPRPPGTTYAYSFLVLGAFVPYALAVWWSGRIGLPRALLGAALLHAVLLPAAVTQSQDLYAYLFYGKVWALGGNPYLDLPLRFASHPWFPYLRFPDQPTVYGPLWTLVTGGIVRLAGESIGVAFALTKALVASLTAAAVWALVRTARNRDRDPARAVVLFAWNPLVLISLPLGGHADAAVAACFLAALVSDHRKRTTLASLLLAAAALVKAYAGIVLLVYLVAVARRGWRPFVGSAASAIGLAAVTYAPFWAGTRTFTGLIHVGGMSSASLAAAVQEGLSALGLTAATAGWIVRALGIAIVALVLVRGARPKSFGEDPWPAATAAFAAYVAVAPWFLYWHQVGLLALVAVAASIPVRAAAYTFSATSMLTVSGGTRLGRALQAIPRYGIPALAWWRVRSAGGSPGPARSHGRPDRGRGRSGAPRAGPPAR